MIGERAIDFLFAYFVALRPVTDAEYDAARSWIVDHMPGTWERIVNEFIRRQDVTELCAEAMHRYASGNIAGV